MIYNLIIFCYQGKIARHNSRLNLIIAARKRIYPRVNTLNALKHFEKKCIVA